MYKYTELKKPVLHIHQQLPKNSFEISQNYQPYKKAPAQLPFVMAAHVLPTAHNVIAGPQKGSKATSHWQYHHSSHINTR